MISGLTTTGFHGRHVPQVSVKIDRVEAAERFLADIGAEPCRAAKHLFVEDAAIHAA